MKVLDYSQGDKNWGSLPYPKLPYCMRLNGCGPTTVANLVAGLTGKKITPEDTGKWMVKHDYAVPGHGTEWAGMPACLKAYGLTDKEYATVKGSFSAFKKHKTGYVLMGKGTRGGVTWTASGHYLAVADYKEKNGKHYFYLEDSGNRGNDGWFCYETTMYGMVNQIHVVTVKASTPKKTSTKASTTKKKTSTAKKKTSTLEGFDISYVQTGLKEANFKKAKAAGWDFVIIRVGTILGGKLHKDSEFESKYKAARAAGLKVGVYWYSMATTTETAEKEAKFVLKILNSREIEYPVFYDIEDSRQRNLGKDKNKKICQTFCKAIEAAGYQAGVYASYDWLTNRIGAIDKRYAVWLAQYPKATYTGRYEMHQYTSTGKVAGIGQKIDCNTTTLKPVKKN